MQKNDIFSQSLKHQIWRWFYYPFNRKDVLQSIKKRKEKGTVDGVAIAAMPRFGVPALHLIKTVVLCVRNMNTDLICANYIRSVKEITFRT